MSNNYPKQYFQFRLMWVVINHCSSSISMYILAMGTYLLSIYNFFFIVSSGKAKIRYSAWLRVLWERILMLLLSFTDNSDYSSRHPFHKRIFHKVVRTSPTHPQCKLHWWQDILYGCVQDKLLSRIRYSKDSLTPEVHFPAEFSYYPNQTRTS